MYENCRCMQYTLLKKKIERASRADGILDCCIPRQPHSLYRGIKYEYNLPQNHKSSQARNHLAHIAVAMHVYPININRTLNTLSYRLRSVKTLSCGLDDPPAYLPFPFHSSNVCPLLGASTSADCRWAVKGSIPASSPVGRASHHH